MAADARSLRGRLSHSIAAIAVLVACSIAMGTVGCDRWRAPRPNIVLVTIDTLRADRLSSYGYHRATSPFIDRLAEGGVRFERAYSSTSWTAPALVSLLTSLPPAIHGVEHGFLSDGEVVRQEVIPDLAPVWAELLQEAGYRTFGVTANGHLEPHLGFARGFDRYECLGFVGAEKVEARVAEWADEILPSEPYFLWLHFFDPHAPYAFHESFTPQFTKRKFRYRRLETEPVAEFLKKHGMRLGNDRYRYVQGLYDGEIRRTDAVIERIFEALGVSEEELVIVTSDHGEEFLEHERVGHGNSLFEEVIRVPLIMNWPGESHVGRVIESPVSLLDLLPSVLDHLQIDPPAGLRGRSLLPAMRGREDAKREVITTLSRFPGLETRSLTQGRWKYIDRWAEPSYRALFDLERDPGEERDLLEAEAERADSMARRLSEFARDAEQNRLETSEEVISDERVDELKSLGYVE